ncbi:MAG: DUF2892 domain-containing protein [Haloferacaceae archaeon]
MERNVGETDRLVRIAVGAIAGLASLGFLSGVLGQNGILALVLGVVAIAMLVTGFTRTCGAYSLIGVNTSKR